MISQQLLEHAREQLAAGVSPEALEQELLKHGWAADGVKEAITAASNSTIITPRITPLPAHAAVPQMPAMTGGRGGEWMLLTGIAVGIGALMYWGLSMVVPPELSLFTLFEPEAQGMWFYFLIPGVVIGLLALGASSVWGVRVIWAEGKPIHGFLLGVSVYLLLLFGIVEAAQYAAAQYANTLPEDGPFVVGLMFSSSFLYSAQIFYGLLVILMLVLIVASRRRQREPLKKRAPWVVYARGAIIAAGVVLTLYVFGAAAPVALITGEQWVCNAVYPKQIKTRCFLTNTATLSETSAPSGEFVIEKSGYAEIKDLHDIGGKLAYAFENDDGTSGVVYDGKVVSGAYSKVGILPIEDLGGKLAYEAIKGDKTIIVYDGDEYGLEYDRAHSPTLVGGKLAFLAQKGTVRPDIKQVVVWDGKEYGTEYAGTGNIMDIDGQLGYQGGTLNNQYLVVGDTKYGPYQFISWTKYEGGHTVSKVRKNDEQLYLVDGVEIGNTDYDYLTDMYAFVDGKFAFAGARNKELFVVYDGKEVGVGSGSSEVGPFRINNKLAYIDVNVDGTAQLFVDGVATGPVFEDRVNNVAVSEQGKVAIQTESETKEMAVYIDGKEVYRGKGGNPFGFFGERLLVWVKEDGLDGLWIDGKVVGKGFFGFSYIELVNGRFVIVGSVRVGDKIERSLLIEQ
ncbi:MAG: hypothetical protein AAB955_02060 [Patescibacteria group bacterium]|mgnify:CR=1 FL=1